MQNGGGGKGNHEDEHSRREARPFLQHAACSGLANGIRGQLGL